MMRSARRPGERRLRQVIAAPPKFVNQAIVHALAVSSGHWLANLSNERGVIWTSTSHNRRGIAMTIQDLGAIGDLVGGVAVLVTLVYLAMQIKQNTKVHASLIRQNFYDAT